jgi:hypothetical protein
VSPSVETSLSLKRFKHCIVLGIAKPGVFLKPEFTYAKFGIGIIKGFRLTGINFGLSNGKRKLSLLRAYFFHLACRSKPR